jgi:glycosyltransferase involved in cell wall biosynthesis
LFGHFSNAPMVVCGGEKLMQLSIVVPCYNEASVLPDTAEKLRAYLLSRVRTGRIGQNSTIVFVDDGSTDRTWSIIEELASSDVFRGIKLSRNFGHQYALLAGVLLSGGDVVVSLDADLQDDYHAIDSMMDAFLAGAEVVYGVRASRGVETLFKRTSAMLFYRVAASLGVDLVYNHADFRLLSRRAVSALREFSECNLFLRGVVPQLGFRAATVYCNRSVRAAGVSHYSLRKMFDLALTGICSSSSVPLRLVTYIGSLVVAMSVAMAFWCLFARWIPARTMPGWASIVVPLYLLGGIQLLALGVIGEYLSRVYIETKRRPRFIVEKTTSGTCAEGAKHI